MTTLLHDLRYALRGLRRAPGFTVIAALTLALGIGASTAIFSVVNGVMLRALPFPEPDELVRVWHVNEGGGLNSTLSYPNIEDLRELNTTLAGLAGYWSGTVAVPIGRGIENVHLAFVTEDFFDVLGVRPVLGRLPTLEEWQWQSQLGAIVSHGFWQQRFGGSPDILGTTFEVEGFSITVIGVLPPGTGFPEQAEVWIPRPPFPESRTSHSLLAIARLRDGTSIRTASVELSSIAARLLAEYGDDTQMHDVELQPLHAAVIGSVRPALLILLGASGLLLLIACGNVVNLLLARATARHRESAVRVALGAGRARLLQHFLAESTLLALAGGVIGMLIAVWSVPAILQLVPTSLPRMDEIRVDGAVLGFAIAVSTAVALAMGFISSARASRGELRSALAAGTRSDSGLGRGVRAGLVITQVALTSVLLVGAGLLVRSFLNVITVDPGFRAENVVFLDISYEAAQDDAVLSSRAVFHDELAERLRALPGVVEVGTSSHVPLASLDGWAGTFLIVDGHDDVKTQDEWSAYARNLPGRTGHAEFRGASAGYFRALGIPLIRGRLFDGHDSWDAPHVAVISESLARERWPDEDPIGKLINFGNMDGDLRALTIVGIVGDVREASLELEPRPTIYANIHQRATLTARNGALAIRTQGDPRTVVAAARNTALELDPTITVEASAFDEILAASLAGRRFTLFLLGAFAATALLIAAVGLYGVIAYLVAQRAREVGIRIALGAQTAEVTRMVVAQGARLALVGVAIGIAAALTLTRFLSGLVFGIGTTDPVTFVVIAVLLTAVAIAASWVPALRAARVDPAIALRSE